MTDRIVPPAPVIDPDAYAPAPLRPPAPASVVVLLVLVLVAASVTAAASIVTAHNSSETCRSVSDGGFLGEPEPCW